MERLVDTVIQYGIAGVALWMMYSITYNHLTDIKELLCEILTVLQNL